MQEYSRKVICLTSGDEEDVIVGNIYNVVNGLLYTKLSPIEREQQIDYANIDELNLCEARYGNKFAELNETIIKTIFDFDDELDISWVKFTHQMSREELIDFIKKVDYELRGEEDCEDIDYEDDDYEEPVNVYEECGHNIDTLVEELVRKMPTLDIETITSITVNSYNVPTFDTKYDVELKLW